MRGHIRKPSRTVTLKPGAKPAKPAAPKPLRQWRVKIVGLVTRVQGGTRVAAPHGEYVMRETDLGGFLLAREGGPKFALTAAEAAAHIEGKAIKIVEGTWP
jgi:hypothetical protein